MKLGAVFLLLVILLGSLFLFNSPIARAACPTILSNQVSCSASQQNPYCVCSGGQCQWGGSCSNGTRDTRVCVCDSQQEARDCACGTGSQTGPSCPGTCNSGACGTNGGGNCNDFNGDLNRCRSVPGCYEDFGVCNGKYCLIDVNGSGCSNVGGRDVCVAQGCSWIPEANSCSSTSVCTNGTCQTACGDTASCTMACVPTTCAAQGSTCGTISDGCGGSLNCGAPTCTVSSSPASLTLMVGRGALLSSNVTITSSCGSTSSVDWNSTNPGVASVGTPGTQTVVTGVSSGTVNINATANLTPPGSCSTTTPTTVTVVRSFFQTFGGDVTSKGAISDPFLPSGKYISGR